MPKFYFHIREGGELIRDEEGMELPDIAAAMHEARESARDFIIEALKSRQEINGRKIEITDGSGNVLEVFAVRDILKR